MGGPSPPIAGSKPTKHHTNVLTLHTGQIIAFHDRSHIEYFAIKLKSAGIESKIGHSGRIGTWYLIVWKRDITAARQLLGV